jgi:hypothetical protein
VKRLIVVGAAALLVVGGLVAAGVAPAKRSDARSRAVAVKRELARKNAQIQSYAGVRKVAAVPDDQAAVVSELGRPQRQGDAVPLQWRRSLDGETVPHGINIDLARKVDVAGVNAWLAPSDDGVCLVTGDPEGLEHGFGIDCGTPTEVESGVVVADWRSGKNPDVGESTVVGVAPDGVASVIVNDRDGSSARVAVHHNVFAHAGGGASEITMTTRNGVQHKQLGTG